MWQINSIFKQGCGNSIVWIQVNKDGNRDIIYTLQPPQDGVQSMSRFNKVHKHIAVNIDIICTNISTQTQMLRQHIVRITHTK